MTDNIDDSKFIGHLIDMQRRVNGIFDFDNMIFEYYATKKDQKTMLSTGFIGDFIHTSLPCEKVEKPYIKYNEYLENELQGREHVQCPLYGKKCDTIMNSTSSGALPCEVLLGKLEKMFDNIPKNLYTPNSLN